MQPMWSLTSARSVIDEDELLRQSYLDITWKKFVSLHQPSGEVYGNIWWKILRKLIKLVLNLCIHTC